MPIRKRALRANKHRLRMDFPRESPPDGWVDRYASYAQEPFSAEKQYHGRTRHAALTASTM
jgi:hypothetical protein